MLLDGQDIYAGGVDPMAIRRRIGMVFQRPESVSDALDSRQHAGVRADAA